MRRGASIYLVTRTHGLRTHLIQPRDIQVLARVKTLKDVSDGLMKSEYGTEIGQLPTQEQDTVTLEGIFLKKLVDRFLFLRRAAQGKMQDLLTRYCTRFEVENVKRILRAKLGGLSAEEPKLIPLAREYSLVNFQALLKAKDVNEIASLLRDTPYHSVLEKLQPYKESGATMILETALDRIYFAKVWEMVGKVKGTSDLIGEEMDLRNLLTVFSLKSREVPSRVVEEATIPLSYAIPKPTLRSLIQNRLEEASNILAPTYSRLASEAVNLLKSGSSSPLEWLFFKQLYHDAAKTAKATPLQAGYVIAYLLLCECEARNLVSIVTGKQLNLSEEEISKGLLGIYD